MLHGEVLSVTVPDVHLIYGSDHALQVLAVGVARLILVAEVDLIGGFFGGQVPLVGKVDWVLKMVLVVSWSDL